MKRRAFLDVAAKAGLTAAITAATWPQFLRDAFADEPKEPQEPAEYKDPRDPKNETEAQKRERLAVLSDGYRRAQKAGKPLLVIIIPETQDQKWLRGEYFGSFLNHGTAEQLYALALCEVICGTMNDLRQLVPTVGLGEPLMVLVETDRIPATVRRLEARLPAPSVASRGFPQSPKEWEERQRREDQDIDSRSALFGKLIRDAVVGDAALLEQRTVQLRAAIPAAELSPIEALLRAKQPPGLTAADRAAALVALSAQNADKGARLELHRLLARSVEERLRKQRVPGSHWARRSGCGTTVEGAEDRSPMVACGMGHVPEKSARFLYFFAVPKRGTLSAF